MLVLKATVIFIVTCSSLANEFDYEEKQKNNYDFEDNTENDYDKERYQDWKNYGNQLNDEKRGWYDMKKHRDYESRSQQYLRNHALGREFRRQREAEYGSGHKRRDYGDRLYYIQSHRQVDIKPDEPMHYHRPHHHHHHRHHHRHFKPERENIKYGPTFDVLSNALHSKNEKEDGKSWLNGEIKTEIKEVIVDFKNNVTVSREFRQEASLGSGDKIGTKAHESDVKIGSLIHKPTESPKIIQSTPTFISEMLIRKKRQIETDELKANLQKGAEQVEGQLSNGGKALMESAKVYAFKIGDSIKNFASDMSEKIKSLFG